MVDMHLAGFVNPHELQDEIRESLRRLWPDRDTWAMSTDTESGTAIMEAQAARLTPEQREELRRQRDESRAARGA